MGNGSSTAALLSDTKRFSREELRAIMAEKFDELAFAAAAASAGSDGVNDGCVSKEQVLELVDLASAGGGQAGAPPSWSPLRRRPPTACGPAR